MIQSSRGLIRFPGRPIATAGTSPVSGRFGLRRKHTALGVLVSALTLALVLAGCGSSNSTTSQQSNKPKSGGTLTVGLQADVTTLDPLKSTSLYDREVMYNIYDRLVDVDAKNNIVPDVATSWTYPTPTSVVFTLRSGIQFQDGTPLNADAVVFNINRILNNPTSPRHSEISTVTSVQAVDSTHVQFNLSKPFSPLLAALSDRAGMILSPTAVQSLGSGLANAPTNAGSGPFSFTSWVKGDHLTITRNPHYWQKDSFGTALPYLATVTFKPITNESVMYTNLETGTINAAQGLAPSDTQSAKSNPSLVYKQIPGLSFNGFMLNTKSAPLDNVNVRQAIEWGVNRQEIVTSVLDNIGVVAQGPIPPSSWAYSSSFAPYGYDTNKAKALLQQAGMSSATFTLLIASGSPVNAQEAQFLQQELAPAGITVNIKQENFSTILSDIAAHNYQAALVGWSGRPDPDGNVYGWFHTGGGFNDMQYSNSQVDTLLDDARTTSTQSQRAQDYQQAEQQILQDASYVFINYGVAIQATTKNVQNFPLLPSGMMPFTQTYLS
jgi:peptide/nickel transport system substrate-binding protein